MRGEGYSYADQVDLAQLLRQRKLAAEMFGGGVEGRLARVLLQRSAWVRKHKRVCPRCGAMLRYGNTIIDYGPHGMYCKECSGD